MWIRAVLVVLCLAGIGWLGSYAVSDYEPETIVVRETVYVNDTVVETYTETVVSREYIAYTTTQTVEVPAKEPLVITVLEEPLYHEESDFTEVEVFLSNAPSIYVPWYGNGVPYLNVRYWDRIDHDFNGTDIYHAANIAINGNGIDFCDFHYYRFDYWNATAVEGRVSYWTSPVAKNPEGHLSNGANCYSRLYVHSTWRISVCAEYDGSISSPRRELDEVNNIIYHYVDDYDRCYNKVIAL